MHEGTCLPIHFSSSQTLGEQRHLLTHTNTPASPGTFFKESVHTGMLQPGDLAMSTRLFDEVQSLKVLWESWGSGWSFSGAQHLSVTVVSLYLYVDQLRDQ